ncbi:hypothetical protein SCHPADRAFT_993623 [Schizopora paradoxa]|uniref:Uncharacterized protein n=1 Tax=Schizopora paradoxa TaxID=27342 RepID=A0A0H2S9N8_9AGAM|nr:hypothetical protein SCHPADRAFT_993623 [Schizopora paradoxa]
MHEMEIPHDVLLSIQRILNLQENVEGNGDLASLSSDFSPVGVLNTLFPDEASLANIETIQTRLAEDAHDLRQEIESLKEELETEQDPQRMQLLQEMISDLMGQMSRIREQATESEAVVQSITKDIQKLDMTKKNLTTSMTMLKRFQMLANATSQLDELVKEKKYSETSQSLAAVKELSVVFKPYLSIPRIALLWTRIQKLQSELRTKLDHDFDAFFLPDPAKPIRPSTISNACLVVDVLGDDFRHHLLERYTGIELKEYRRIFRITDEAGQLDNLNRRFAFFRRLLQAHDTERANVFPTEWKVGEHLSAKFIDITREDLSSLLGKAGPSLTVATLLQSLQQCLDFEAFISKKYTFTIGRILTLSSTITSRPMSSLASAFEPHMGVFIDAQDKALADMLAPHRGKKSRTSLEETALDKPSTVLPSSTELFYFYGQTLEQCSKLFTGKPLFDLSALFRKWLRLYAEDVLMASLKRPTNQGRRSLDSKFDVNELKNACIVLNTAEYCQVTASELEEKLIDKINEEYKEKVSLQAERDVLIGVASAAIIAQLRELEAACDASFDMLVKTAWSSTKTVSGPSAFVKDLTKGIDSVASAVQPLIEQKKYLRNFLDKAAALIMIRFTNAVVKSRPLREAGAEQLLLDLQELKLCLMKLAGDASASFARNVSKSTSQLETLFKVIIPPADPAEAFIQNYTVLIGDASFSNFQKVLDLKGTPRVEQNALLDSFLSITSKKDDLADTSFLSTLDMDPPATSQTGGLTSPSGSRLNLPSLIAGPNSGVDGLLSTLTSPGASGPPTGSETSGKSGESTQKQVFNDLRRLVSFGLRRDTSS